MCMSSFSTIAQYGMLTKDLLLGDSVSVQCAMKAISVKNFQATGMFLHVKTPEW